ncbi:hypothetical protein D3C87_323860 [compost metagenome]
MTQVSSYFATMGIEIDKRSFAEVDKYFERLEQKLAKVGKTSNAFAVNLKFNVDTAKARLTIQRDLNTISRGLTLKLNTFSINNKALRNLLNQSMSNRAGNARIKLNVALSAASLTNMRTQVLAALNNLVISPQINPRITPRGGNGNGSGGTGSGGRSGRDSTGFGMNSLMRWGLPLAGLYGAQRGFMSFAEATQLQATRDVASRGLFQNATMPDGSTRDVYANSEQWFRGYTNRVGLDRNALTPSYQGFMAASMPTLGYEKAQKVFEAFSSFGTVRGATGDSMKRGLVAVQQMASKGTVNAEELKQQLGDAQGFGEAQILFAQAYQMMKNKTNNPLDPRLMKGSKATSELGDAMKKNKLISSELLPIVSELMMAKARPALEAASQTGTANQNRFNNARTSFFENFAKGGGDAGMSNIWKALGDLTQQAADNAEMLGANFRVATAYVRIFLGEVADLIDYITGDAKDGNIFKQIFTPEMEQQIRLIGENLAIALGPLTNLDMSNSTAQIKGFLQEILSLVQALTSVSTLIQGIVTLDRDKFMAGLKGFSLGVAGAVSPVAQQQLSGLLGNPGIPNNTPQAASTAPLANYGATGNRNSTNSIIINNQVTVTDKNQLGATIDQVNQSTMASNLQPFLTTMDKSAFPNSGQ